MLKTRVIPTLLLKGRGLYKGSRFRDFKYIGDPINAVKIFNEKEVDELVLLDIDATNEGREPDYDFLRSITAQAFMPLGYGGGISRIEQVEKLFTCGVEKAILNTVACVDTDLVRKACAMVGSQGIVVSVDVGKGKKGRPSVFSNSGRKDTGLDPVVHARRMEEAGAGEIILCSIDHEGCGEGYDLPLLREVASSLDIPVVASGGAANLAHMRAALDAGASAVAAGSMFVFQGKYKAVLISYPKYEELAAALSPR